MNAKHDRIAYLTDLRQPPARKNQASPSEINGRIIHVLPGQAGRSKRTANSDPSDPLPGHPRPLSRTPAQCPALRQATASGQAHVAPDGQRPAPTGGRSSRPVSTRGCQCVTCRKPPRTPTAMRYHQPGPARHPHRRRLPSRRSGTVSHIGSHELRGVNPIRRVERAGRRSLQRATEPRARSAVRRGQCPLGDHHPRGADQVNLARDADRWSRIWIAWF